MGRFFGALRNGFEPEQVVRCNLEHGQDREQSAPRYAFVGEWRGEVMNVAVQHAEWSEHAVNCQQAKGSQVLKRRAPVYPAIIDDGNDDRQADGDDQKWKINLIAADFIQRDAFHL